MVDSGFYTLPLSLDWLLYKILRSTPPGGSKPDKAQTPLQGDFVVKQKQSKETAP